ncbi:TPA: helix-turn-helix transcriptional regulator, partial [Streptococcus agalactiae]|nr:helix-turn-helix transcriptional regulator [Streptococcus agalactiae]
MQQFNLKQLREKKGFTQNELADKANVSRSLVVG